MLFISVYIRVFAELVSASAEGRGMHIGWAGAHWISLLLHVLVHGTDNHHDRRHIQIVLKRRETPHPARAALCRPENTPVLHYRRITQGTPYPAQ